VPSSETGQSVATTDPAPAKMKPSNRLTTSSFPGGRFKCQILPEDPAVLAYVVLIRFGWGAQRRRKKACITLFMTGSRPGNGFKAKRVHYLQSKRDSLKPDKKTKHPCRMPGYAR
jgi:hypothetical protein